MQDAPQTPSSLTPAEAETKRKGIPLIIDTDPGDDIDDTWALVMLLNSDEVDIRLIVTANGDTTKRAQIVAKLLTVAGRTDVDIGIGKPTGMGKSAFMKAGPGAHYEWAKDFDLASYKGTVHQDGIRAIMNLINATPEDAGLTILGIAPSHNIGEVLARDSGIARKVRYVGMQGSIKKTQRLEYNISSDVAAARLVFSAPWREMRITPLDTCGQVVLDGDRYKAVTECDTPLARALIECTTCWASGPPGMMVAKMLKAKPTDPATALIKSSTLFDCAAAHLVFSTDCFAMRKMRIAIDAVGRTAVVDDQQEIQEIDVAIDWSDKQRFLDLLVRRLTHRKSDQDLHKLRTL